MSQKRTIHYMVMAANTASSVVTSQTVHRRSSREGPKPDQPPCFHMILGEEDPCCRSPGGNNSVASGGGS